MKEIKRDSADVTIGQVKNNANSLKPDEKQNQRVRVPGFSCSSSIDVFQQQDNRMRRGIFTINCENDVKERDD